MTMPQILYSQLYNSHGRAPFSMIMHRILTAVRQAGKLHPVFLGIIVFHQPFSMIMHRILTAVRQAGKLHPVFLGIIVFHHLSEYLVAHCSICAKYVINT